MLIWLSLLSAGMMIKQAYMMITCIGFCRSGRLRCSIAYDASQLGHIKVVKVLAHGANACLRSREIQALHFLLCMLWHLCNWIWSDSRTHEFPISQLESIEANLNSETLVIGSPLVRIDLGKSLLCDHILKQRVH